MESDSSDMPRGTVIVHGNDIGLIGAVTIEVDGKPVCRLHPEEVQRTMRSSGNSAVTLRFAGSMVGWRAEMPAESRKEATT